MRASSQTQTVVAQVFDAGDPSDDDGGGGGGDDSDDDSQADDSDGSDSDSDSDTVARRCAPVVYIIGTVAITSAHKMGTRRGKPSQFIGVVTDPTIAAVLEQHLDAEEAAAVRKAHVYGSYALVHQFDIGKNERQLVIARCADGNIVFLGESALSREPPGGGMALALRRRQLEAHMTTAGRQTRQSRRNRLSAAGSLDARIVYDADEQARDSREPHAELRAAHFLREANTNRALQRALQGCSQPPACRALVRQACAHARPPAVAAALAALGARAEPPLRGWRSVCAEAQRATPGALVRGRGKARRRRAPPPERVGYTMFAPPSRWPAMPVPSIDPKLLQPH